MRLFSASIVVVLGTLVVSSCASKPKPKPESPTPHPLAPSATSTEGKKESPRETPEARPRAKARAKKAATATAGEAEQNYTIVAVHYATDRERTASLKPASFFSGIGSPNETISYGICQVTIPRDHQPGELESPSILKLEFREDPEKHVVLIDVLEQRKDDFFQTLSQRIAKSKGKEAFVFVHGYNVTFEDAARRTAQISHDLIGYDGAPILYSWPSLGEEDGYVSDEESVDWTTRHLQAFLKDVADRSGAQVVHLIAHSMGNRALTKALAAMAQEPSGASRPKFNQIILAAPDIRRENFLQLAEDIKNMGTHVTLYASSKDRALELSRRFHGWARAGESTGDIVVIKGIDTIDVSTIATDFLGHSYVANNKTILSDLLCMLRGNAPAERRGLSRILRGELPFWLFPANFGPDVGYPACLSPVHP